MPGSGEEYELERLRNLLEHERQTNELLQQSLSELQVTVEDLDKRVEGLDDDSSEWKTRYETQVETNQQLHLQTLVLAEKVEEAKRNLKDSEHIGKLPRNLRSFDDTIEVTPQYVKTLERSKQIFESQLRDLEWRLEQESKAYHKANEERKNYVTEINNSKGTVYSLKHPAARPGFEHGDHSTRVINITHNIPQDYRVIDPKRGPIRRTAAVRVLPSLQ